MRDSEKEISVEGVSIGGGKIEVVAINGFNIAISGNYPALLVFHKDTFGTIGRVANILGDSSINVGSMQVSRKEKGDQALMTCELDDAINDEIIEKLKRRWCSDGFTHGRRMMEVITCLKVWKN